jgi:hypothetical protein
MFTKKLISRKTFSVENIFQLVLSKSLASFDPIWVPSRFWASFGQVLCGSQVGFGGVPGGSDQVLSESQSNLGQSSPKQVLSESWSSLGQVPTGSWAGADQVLGRSWTGPSEVPDGSWGGPVRS